MTTRRELLAMLAGAAVAPRCVLTDGFNPLPGPQAALWAAKDLSFTVTQSVEAAALHAYSRDLSLAFIARAKILLGSVTSPETMALNEFRKIDRRIDDDIINELGRSA